MFGAYAALVLLLFHCLPEFVQGHRSSRMDGGDDGQGQGRSMRTSIAPFAWVCFGLFSTNE